MVPRLSPTGRATPSLLNLSLPAQIISAFRLTFAPNGALIGLIALVSTK